MVSSRRHALRALSTITLLTFTASAVGCGAPSLPRSNIPKNDPTPLAKCKVTASHNEPLVTEWPASEKSRLEALLDKGAVAVSYSGCEMRVLGACSVKGSYAFKRTTLATDTVEINDEDQLYAKLPLGAARLAADLERSGRLAVRTTVAGQYALSGATVADVPSDGECKDATHLVTGLSVGAFKMLAGGKAKVSGGASVGGAGVGGAHAEEETTLTEAGDPAACPQTADAPNPQCKSPLQVFLEPIPNRSAALPTARAGMQEEEKPPPDAVRVNFAASSEGEHWSLLTRDGKLVCDLPCSRWVAPKSGYKLQLDADKKEDIKTVPVPDDLGYSAGRTVDAVPRSDRGIDSTGAAVVAITSYTFGGIFFVGGIAGAIAVGSSSNSNDHGSVPLFAGMAILGGCSMLVATGLLIYRRDSSLDMSLARTSSASTRPVLRLGPGFLEAGSQSTAHVFLTPSGAFGTF